MLPERVGQSDDVLAKKYLDKWRAIARQGVAEARGLLRAVLVNLSLAKT
jgi:hypothetical protein